MDEEEVIESPVGSVVDEEEELEEEEVGSDVESVEMDAAEGGKTRGIKLKKSGGTPFFYPFCQRTTQTFCSCM